MLPSDALFECEQAPAAQPAPHKAAMTPEAFLDFSGPQPIDADEIREAVERLLLSGAPPAITRVVGRAAYERCVRAQCQPCLAIA